MILGKTRKQLILISILLSFLSIKLNAQCDYKALYKNEYFKLECCKDLDSISVNPYSEFYKLKCLLNEKSYSEFIERMKTLNSVLEMEDIESEKVELRYKLLKLSYRVFKNLNEHHLAKSIEKQLVNLVRANPQFLLSDIYRFREERIYKAKNINDFVSDFDFYLFSKHESLKNNKLIELENELKSIVHDIIYIPRLRKQLENCKNVSAYEKGETPFKVEIELFKSKFTLYPEYNSSLLMRNNPNFKCDTIVIYDYFVLESWKEPVFIDCKIVNDKCGVENEISMAIRESILYEIVK